MKELKEWGGGADMAWNLKLYDKRIELVHHPVVDKTMICRAKEDKKEKRKKF